jgi:RNA polymerase sigma-70 factor (ECF subfamily)
LQDDKLVTGKPAGAVADQDRMVDHARACFTALFDKYRSSLFRYLTGLVTSPDDAAELVQESYARLLQHQDVAQIESVNRTYLFQIATNLARDHYRRHATRRSGTHVDIDDLDIEDQRAGPEDNLSLDNTVDSIKAAIKELPTMTRRILLLSRFRGKTYPQIALLLGVSTRTVERKMSEAMQLLATRLKERP